MGHGSSPWLVACCGARCRRLQCGRRRRRCRRSWSGSAARASACATQRTCNERARSAQGGPRPCGQVAALEVLAETSGPEVDSLRSALEWNKIVIRVCGGSPDHRVQGVHRTGTKRRADLDAQRALEVASLEERRARLQRLEASRPREPTSEPRLQEDFVPMCNEDILRWRIIKSTFKRQPWQAMLTRWHCATSWVPQPQIGASNSVQ